MICYIKDKRTYRTKHHANVVDFDMTVRSIYDEVTSITIPTYDTVQDGDIVVVGEFLGVISGHDVGSDTVTIKCDDIITMFSRDLVEIPSELHIESMLKTAIEQEYKSITDPLYAMPYIVVETATFTPYILPEIENGVWSVKSYINRVRRIAGVFVDFVIEKNNLRVRITRREVSRHNIDLSTAQYVVTEETYGNEQTGRITAYTGGVRSDWYLLTDGTVTKTYTAKNRIDGRWETLVLDADADTHTDVISKFAENSYSHMIEFETDKIFNFYDLVTLRTPKGRVLNSYISAIRKRNGARTVYKTGELRIMLDEKINQIMAVTPTNKAQLGLGHVDDTPDKDKPVSDNQSSAINAVQGNVNRVAGALDVHNDDDVRHTNAIEKIVFGDKYTQLETNLKLKFVQDVVDINTNARHSHSNKIAIDTITQTLINAWNTVGNKVDKITGKGLSANDYTTVEKNKLGGVAEGANKYILPIAGNVPGGIKSGTDITVDSNGNVSVVDDSHNHVVSNVDGLQGVLDGCYKYIKTLTSTDNLNNIFVTGIYHNSANAYATIVNNYPVPYAGRLDVLANGSMLYQTYTTYNTGVIYTRCRYSNTWTGWVTMARTVDVPIVVQAFGTSTTAVMSQKSVTDAINTTGAAAVKNKIF